MSPQEIKAFLKPLGVGLGAVAVVAGIAAGFVIYKNSREIKLLNLNIKQRQKELEKE
jgi:hypothetical protein